MFGEDSKVLHPDHWKEGDGYQGDDISYIVYIVYSIYSIYTGYQMVIKVLKLELILIQFDAMIAKNDN